MKIKVVVHEADEGGYWGEVPSIPGCATHGESFEDLLGNLCQAAEGCLSSLYVELKGEPGLEAREVAYGLDVDLDPAGYVVGFDIHHASNRLDISTLDVEALPLRSHKVG